MTADPQADAVLALHRFGLGPRPGSIAADPRGAILAEFDASGAGRLNDPGLLTSAEAARINRGKGLNENLAREIMELHMLGVRAGYTQEDVTLKRPGEWIFGALRATGVTPPDSGPVIQAQNLLGEPLWRPPAPNGFADDSAAWMDGLARRLDVANMLARRLAASTDPDVVAAAALGPLASTETRQATARAESRPQARAVLLMSAEFQRR